MSFTHSIVCFELVFASLFITRMDNRIKGEKLANLVLSRSLVVDGMDLVTMPSIALQRIIRQINPSYSTDNKTDSEMRNMLVMLIYNHLNQLDSET